MIDVSFPSCVKRITSMRYPNLPSAPQCFFLACYLFQNGYPIEQAEKIFKEIFEGRMDEEKVREQLRNILIRHCEPFPCFVVKMILGVCSPACNRYPEAT